ncbi:MAG TPA: GAF domain-containing protein [Prolixibacteraceae bacterium]|nr:GAF domain-containing protein [Prolixibacteraceae bacterium]
MDQNAIISKIEQLTRNLSNKNEILLETCKILQNEVAHYDWVGFYMLDETEKMLLLGPYVGKTTEHTLIPIGKGVCGQVAENKKTMIVQDVSKMENYIACSLEVQSEIVIPILKNGNFVAEIDIDSHAFAPFGNNDQHLLEKVANILSQLF